MFINCHERKHTGLSTQLGSCIRSVPKLLVSSDLNTNSAGSHKAYEMGKASHTVNPQRFFGTPVGNPDLPEIISGKWVG